MTVPPRHRIRPTSPSVSVVIPADVPEKVPALLRALPPVDEVIVVVGRGDDVGRALPRGARTIRQTRAGAGNAIACGVQASTGDVVVTVPGDGSADPAELPRLLTALRAGADVAHGSRYPAGRPGLLDLILLGVLRVLFGCRPTDPGHGFHAFWRDSAGRLGLPRVAGLDPVRGDGPEIGPLLVARTAAAGLRVAEVPTTAGPRAAGPVLIPAVRALIAEYAARRTAPAGAAESIVVMTGGTRPAHPLVNPPHAPIRPAPAREPSWPAPNQRHEAAVAPGAVNTATPRARGVDARPDAGPRHRGRAVSPRPAAATAGENLARRRWRDNVPARNTRDTGSGRPDLRVINGEGAGPPGRRSGHLRSV